jgi:hypothetical protein
MVYRGFAYVGHMFSKGFSVIDVRDPKRPKAVKYLAALDSYALIFCTSASDTSKLA